MHILVILAKKGHETTALMRTNAHQCSIRVSGSQSALLIYFGIASTQISLRAKMATWKIQVLLGISVLFCLWQKNFCNQSDKPRLFTFIDCYISRLSERYDYIKYIPTSFCHLKTVKRQAKTLEIPDIRLKNENFKLYCLLPFC